MASGWDTLDPFRVRWEITVICNWVTLLPLEERTQTLVFDAHCWAWEEVGSCGPVWLAHSSTGRVPRDASQWASGLRSVTKLRTATSLTWCLRYTRAVDTHRAAESQAESAGRIGGAPSVPQPGFVSSCYALGAMPRAWRLTVDSWLF